MLTRKCDICGREIGTYNSRYTLTYKSPLWSREKDICPLCFEKLKEQLKTEAEQGEPQTDCDTCRHYKLACELFSEICRYEPKTEPQTLDQVKADIEKRSSWSKTYEAMCKTEPQTDCPFGEDDKCFGCGDNTKCVVFDEPQPDPEIAKAIVHKMIDDAVIAEDAYPDLRQKMHDAVDEYEPQTERSE